MKQGNSRFLIFASVLIAPLLLASGLSPTPVMAAPNNFITRDGSNLKDGENTFRFIGVNVPGIVGHADDGTGVNKPTSLFEKVDSYATITQMGGTATRLYTMSIIKPGEDALVVNKLLEGVRTYDEIAFRSLDKALQLANENNVRLIIPFIDKHSFNYGGVADFAALRGKSESQFWSDPILRQDFKNFIYDIVNRTNFYTGVKYKDDKAILAWQLGNELDAGNTEVWSDEMSAYLKSIDANHLVMGGNHRSATDATHWEYKDPNLDIVDYHSHPKHHVGDMSYAVGRAWTAAAGKKALVIGEFAYGATAAELSETLDQIIADGTAGGLVWAVRAHREGGGYWSHPYLDDDNALHWPGFPAKESQYSEITKLNDIRSHAYQIRGIPEPTLPAPAVPTLLPIVSVSDIRWQGSTGARYYDIDRAPGTSGPWTRIATDVMDGDTRNVNPVALYDDSSAPSGTVYYRIRAKNASGVASGWSNTSNGVLNSGPADNISIVIDNVDVPSGDASGLWSASSFMNDYYATDYLYTTNDNSGDSVKFRANPTSAGNYKVYYWLPDGEPGRASNAKFRVWHDQSYTDYYVDQRVSGGIWKLLGTHYMSTESIGNGVVEIFDSGDGNFIVADAIKFEQ